MGLSQINKHLDAVNSKFRKGKGKWFELTGVRINEVKISSKVLQDKLILLRINRVRITGVQLYYHCVSFFFIVHERYYKLYFRRLAQVFLSGMRSD